MKWFQRWFERNAELIVLVGLFGMLVICGAFDIAKKLAFVKYVLGW